MTILRTLQGPPLRPPLRSPLITRYGDVMWSPEDLGSSLLAWWDASRGLTLVGSRVSGWADVKNGYNPVQAVSATRPTFSATSFNGAPGVFTDGVDDYLEMASQPFPAGADPVEIWMVVQQDELVGNAGIRVAVSYGGTSSLVTRYVGRTTGNLGIVTSGNGATAPSATPATVMSSRHLIRARFTATEIALSIDGGAEQTTPVVSTTGTTRFRIGCWSAAVSNYWKGGFRDIVVTGPLSAGQAAQLQPLLMARRNL